MSREGFGDDLTVDEALADYEGWLHARAHRLISPMSPDHDDLVQEGRIAMWKAYETYEGSRGALPAWLTAHANWHMTEAVSRKTWTGMPPRLHGSIPATNDTIDASLDKMMEDGVAIEGMLVAADLSDSMILAYHQGEIAMALSTLTQQQRRYVYLRFWEGYTERGMQPIFGYTPSGLWNSQKNGARLKLRNRLAHLEAA